MAAVLVVVRPARREGAAHLLQLGPRRHLLREQGRLDAVEEALQPAHQLGLGNPEFGLGGNGLLGERERQALQFLHELRGQAVLQLLDRGGMDVLEPDPARLVERRGTYLFQELLDHAADPHDLGGLFDHFRHRDLARLVIGVADRRPVLSHDQDVRGAVLRPFTPRHLHAVILSHTSVLTRCAPVQS